MNLFLVLLKEILLVYGLTLLLCDSSVLNPVRDWIIARTPRLYSPLSMFFPYYQFKLGEKHLVECRMCMGVWISFCVCLYFSNLDFYWVVFGLSYFMTTQERT